MATATEIDVRPGPGPGEGSTAVPPRREPAAARLVRAIGRAPLNLLLVVIALVWLVPAVGLLVSSFRSPADVADRGWWTVLSEPAQLSLDSYRGLLENETITGSFWNTVVITVPTTVGVVLIAALAAYAFAWIRFPGRDWAFLAVVGLLVVPVQVALIPVAEMFGALGIYGDVAGVVLFHISFGLPFAIFLLRNFFAGIPRELLEAARIDGASEFRLFFRVVLPLGLPAIASLAIFQFLWVWNDLLIALVFTGPDSAPLTVAIRNETRQFGANIDVIAPGAFISLAVPLLVFFAFQRYFVQGLLAGAEK